TAKAIGVTSTKVLIGKGVYDLYPLKMAELIVSHHKEVIATGKIVTAEEIICDVDKKIKYFAATIAPLLDNDGNIIGTIGTSIETTKEKQEAELLKKSKVFEHLEKVAQVLPTPFYWLDLDQKYLGVNQLGLQVTGTESYDKNFRGKTPKDLYPAGMAKEIIAHHKEVIRTGKTLLFEESIKDLTTKRVKYFNAAIAPIHDDEGIIVGTIGTSIDI